MSDNQDNLNQDRDENKDDAAAGGTGDGSLDKLVAERVAEALKDIKGKLDGAYSARDEANRKLAEAEQREKEAKLKKMEDEGKVVEALEARLAEANARVEVAERRIVELTRDAEVHAALSGLPFRNERAAKIAYKEIVDGLVQDDKGVWRHRTGVSISEYVTAFAQDEDQSFLFKAKTSSGSGAGTGTSASKGEPKATSLFAMSQDEVLKLAAEGKLRRSK